MRRWWQNNSVFRHFCCYLIGMKSFGLCLAWKVEFSRIAWTTTNIHLCLWPLQASHLSNLLDGAAQWCTSKAAFSHFPWNWLDKWRITIIASEEMLCNVGHQVEGFSPLVLVLLLWMSCWYYCRRVHAGTTVRGNFERLIWGHKPPRSGVCKIWRKAMLECCLLLWIRCVWRRPFLFQDSIMMVSVEIQTHQTRCHWNGFQVLQLCSWTLTVLPAHVLIHGDKMSWCHLGPLFSWGCRRIIFKNIVIFDFAVGCFKKICLGGISWYTLCFMTGSISEGIWKDVQTDIMCSDMDTRYFLSYTGHDSYSDFFYVSLSAVQSVQNILLNLTVCRILAAFPSIPLF